MLRQFSLAEIQSATNCFSDDSVIGKGAFGMVYKGVISDGEAKISAAVKRLKCESKQGEHEFWTEVKMLNDFKHSHILSLIGYCNELDEMILVLEFMPNGSLADHLYKTGCLSWEQRLSISLGAARGLEYLHTGTGVQQRVIHRDVKTSNILLDENWAAKISDLGISKISPANQLYSPIIASVKGTRGYMDPDYCSTHKLSRKADVYAFGVVLLEVLCGRRAVDFRVEERERRLVSWAQQCIREGVLHRIIDPSLKGKISDDGLLTFVDIADKCLQNRPKNRPTMAEVVAKLESALASQYTTASSSVDEEFVKTFESRMISSQNMEDDSLIPWSDDLHTPGKESSFTLSMSSVETKSSPNNHTVDVVNAEVGPTTQGLQLKPVSFSHNMEDIDEYEKLIRRLNMLTVAIDNKSCKRATVIQVNGLIEHGILLEVVQVFNDLDFVITKGYISSDGGWFMDVFNVTDQEGNKITDEMVLYVQQALSRDFRFTSSISNDHTTIELIGSDRPGILSEVGSILADLKCNVVKAGVWTHKTRVAAVVQVTDEELGTTITDPDRLSKIQEVLSHVIMVIRTSDEAKTMVSYGFTHTHIDRRLHQIMFADRDYEAASDDVLDEKQRPHVDVVNCFDKDYSVVTIWCKDRPKLMFDTICTLTDMQYSVFHGNVVAEGQQAYQEYYIRHMDGSPVKSDADRQRVIQGLQAAIERRVSEGLKIKVCTRNRVGLLSDITRIFRENGITITRAEVTTRDGEGINTFYVRDASGCPVDQKIIDSVREAIGQTIVTVKGSPKDFDEVPQESPTKHFWNLGLIKS